MKRSISTITLLAMAIFIAGCLGFSKEVINKTEGQPENATALDAVKTQVDTDVANHKTVEVAPVEKKKAKLKNQYALVKGMCTYDSEIKSLRTEQKQSAKQLKEVTSESLPANKKALRQAEDDLKDLDRKIEEKQNEVKAKADKIIPLEKQFKVTPDEEEFKVEREQLNKNIGKLEKQKVELEGKKSDLEKQKAELEELQQKLEDRKAELKDLIPEKKDELKELVGAEEVKGYGSRVKTPITRHDLLQDLGKELTALGVELTKLNKLLDQKRERQHDIEGQVAQEKIRSLPKDENRSVKIRFPFVDPLPTSQQGSAEAWRTIHKDDVPSNRSSSSSKRKSSPHGWPATRDMMKE